MIVRRLYLVALAFALVGCNQILSIPSTIEEACETDLTCPAERPRCEIASGACQQCLVNAHCPSGMCRPNGVCVEEAEALFALVGATSTVCSRAEPCELAVALSLLTETQNVIALDPVTVFGRTEPIVVTQALALFTYRGTTVAAISAGTTPVELFHVMPGAELTATGVIIRNSTVTGIRCEGGRLGFRGAQLTNMSPAIDATDCDIRVTGSAITNGMAVAVTARDGSLVVERSRVIDNAGGGIDATTATIEASAFRGNGDTDTELGAVRLERGTIVSSTIAGNASSVGFGRAVVCGAAQINNSIVFGNTGGPAFSNDCDVRYTNSDMIQPGTGNLSADPMLDPIDGFHLLPDSPCRGAGDPDLRRGLDIDGELRPQPDDTPPDCGADEIP